MEGYYTIRRGHIGSDVLTLQRFLIGQGVALDGGADGDFGPATQRAVRAFQEQRGIGVDGVFGSESVDAALPLGYANCHFAPPIPASSSEVMAALRKPPRPQDLPQPTAARTAELFGEFDFVHEPTASDPTRIRILGGWVADNIVNIDVPQLRGMVDRQIARVRIMETGRMRVHRLAAPKILRLFERWGEAGLMDRVLYYVGAFNARLKRKATNPTRNNLSNHSWGTAFDINSEENGLGRQAAIPGARGCVRELVEIANEEGFYWGGHFKDGMHFELARL